MENELIKVFRDITMDKDFDDDELVQMLKERNFDVGRLVD